VVVRCRLVFLVAVVLAAAAGWVVLSASAATVINCGSLTIGPTALPTGKNGAGPVCLLRAYRQQCRPAAYELSRFGVDTIARDDFRVVSTNGRCRINVTTSFTVVPQKPHSTGSGECSNLSPLGNDVIARGCVGSGLPSSLSLTGKR